MKFVYFALIFGIFQAMVDESTPLQSRIIKGRNCVPEEYSHLISIAYGGKQYCGASLIARQWVLTAAHCCKMMSNYSAFEIVAGHRVWMQDVQQRSPVETVLMHRDYKMFPLTSDICLVKIKKQLQIIKEVKISTIVSPLEFQYMIDNKQCRNMLVMGFGLQKSKSSSALLRTASSDYNPHVQCTTLEVVGKQLCHDDQLTKQFITASVFCALDPKGKGSDACLGDSGGPVYCKDKQIGVVSAGFGCGNPKQPGFYNRVDVYKGFMDKIVTGRYTGNEFYILQRTAGGDSSGESESNSISENPTSGCNPPGLWKVLTFIPLVLLKYLLYGTVI